MLDSYTRNLERRVRLLLKENARLEAEVRALQDERREQGKAPQSPEAKR